MVWLKIIKVLLITQLCQSLTVIQPIYNNDDNYYKPKQNQDIRKAAASVPNTAIQNQTRKEYGLRNSPKLTEDLAKSNILQPYEWALKTRLLTRLEPYKSGMISNILSIAQPNIAGYHEQPAYSNIYPVQYQYHNPYHKAVTRLTAFNEPVTAATLNTQVLHEPKEIVKFVNNKTQQQQPLLNYNNKVYHINKAISNQSFAQKQQQYPPFVRKQRNLNANHYDDKLIEHNFTEIRADNKDIDDAQDFNRTTASISTIKQPSAATAAASSSSPSHEIRYLHDIFLNYPKYHHVNYGHIELSPHLFQKRFETLKAGNRYKGEVIWLDNNGGYAQHYWNMAQGKL